MRLWKNGVRIRRPRKTLMQLVTRAQLGGLIRVKVNRLRVVA